MERESLRSPSPIWHVQVNTLPGQPNFYELHSMYNGLFTRETAQGLLDIAAYVEQHRPSLEQVIATPEARALATSVEERHRRAAEEIPH